MTLRVAGHVVRWGILLWLALNVGCDGVVGSRAMEDHCGVCGGNNNTCRIVSGIFTRQLTFGYNKITSIPAGACHINITEIRRSRNYLVLKDPKGPYFINGHWQLSAPGNYSVAGTTVVYNRRHGKTCPGQCMYAKGPTNISLELQMLFYHHNPGILYTFTLPFDKMGDLLNNMSPATTITPVRGEHHKAAGRHNAPRHGHHQGRLASSLSRPRMGVDVMSYTNQTGPRLQYGQAPHYVPPHDKQQEQRLSLSVQNQQPHRSRYRAHHRSQTRQQTPEIRPRYNSHYQNANSIYQPRNSVLPSNRLHKQQAARGNYGSRTVLNQQTLRNAYSGKHRSNSFSRNSNYGASRRVSGNSIQQGISLANNEAVPVNPSDSETLYAWRISGFSECSQTCGGGHQETRVVCVKGNSQVEVTSENCVPSLKPKIRTIICNTKPCKAGWETEDWGPCSKTCGEGMQSRVVECQQVISATVHLSVTASLCTNKPRPQVTRRCTSKPCYRWKVADWGKCSAECGHGERNRKVTCVNSDDKKITEDNCQSSKPKSTEVCDMGSCAKAWFHTKWSKQCSSECGTGHYGRKVFCSAEDGSSLDEKKCPPSKKPRTRKHCKNKHPCGGQWFIGPWTECTATCGNGLQKRDVVCMKKLGNDLLAVVKDVNCLASEKPSGTEACEPLPDCPPDWYLTDWSECSASCGTGFKTREVKCMDPDLIHSVECNTNDKPSRRQTCNTDSCHKPQLDAEPGCKDSNTRAHCTLVVQARLCAYIFYQKLCCDSCRKHEHL